MFGFKKGKLKHKDRIPSRDYISILEFLLRDIDDRSFEGLFHSVDRYLMTTYNANNIIIFSTPVLGDVEKMSETYRIVYNREKIGEKYQIEELDRIIEMWKKDNGENDIIFIDDENSTYYSLILGEIDSQKFFCFFKVNSSKRIFNEIIFYVGRFMFKGIKNIFEWRKIRDEGHLIYIDDVTGLYNQRKLLIDLNHQIEQYRQFEKSFVVLFIDIDHFKDVNDCYGHLIGTRVLKELGLLFKDKMRETDYLYRYGGDEFVIILPNCTSSNGQIIGERLLNIVKNHLFDLTEIKNFKLSISIGVASFPKDASDCKGILSMADQMMYCAKDLGRGRVCLAGDLF